MFFFLEGSDSFFPLAAKMTKRLEKKTHKLVGGFTPFEKYARQIGFIFPNFRGETFQKYLYIFTYISHTNQPNVSSGIVLTIDRNIFRQSLLPPKKRAGALRFAFQAEMGPKKKNGG